MHTLRWLLLVCVCGLYLGSSISVRAEDAKKIRVLIIDGQNNHKWKETTPLLQQILDKHKKFTVTVNTVLEKDSASYAPDFSQFDVVVLNYNGKSWSDATKSAFVKFVENGGGFVSYHAANNAFTDWPEFNAMIGVGGWGGRKKDVGAYLRLKDGNFVADPVAGDRAGSHGKQHEFAIETRADHPITAGLPKKWMHAQDELYDRLRGPAKNVTVLGSAFADAKTGGSNTDEPMLMVIPYGKGRVFHTTLGHYVEAVRCVGFATTFARGTEWAATGKVTIPVPADFPTAEKSSSWK